MRAYLAAVAAGWLILPAGAVYYAQLKGIPARTAIPVAAAFLVEYALYLMLAFPGVRRRIADAVPVRVFGLILIAAALLPYLIASLGTGTYTFDNLTRLTVLSGFVSFWWIYRKPGWSSDIALLAVMAAAMLLPFFRRIYLPPVEGLRIDILGQMMLTRTAIIALLEIREADIQGFGFWPDAREWKIGLKYFLLFVPVGFPLILFLKISRFDPNLKEAALAPLTFAGALWFIALREEIFFRGLIQQRLGDAMRKPAAALVISSVLFGLVHLPFRDFPNWPMVAVAAVSGLFYGRAYQEANSVRAAMVAHALTVTCWKSLFS